ncbi:MAG: mechanosensitive ion channel [Lysobacter sp.]|nr:mechanosensitive ion channel [Lysobacter sp.]
MPATVFSGVISRSRKPMALPAAAGSVTCNLLLAGALFGMLLSPVPAWALPTALLKSRTTAAPASATDIAPAAATDRALRERLRARYRGIQELDGIIPALAAGVVRLEGEVESEAQRKLATRITAQSGAATVDNRLQLNTDLSVRLRSAFEQVLAKLVRLLAAAPLLLIAIAIVLLLGWLGRVFSRRLHWMRLRSHNPYMDGLLRGLIRVVFVLAGVLIALDLLGATALVGAVLGSAGLVGLVLGFAFKDIAENYIAGILLSLRRPFAPGDHVVIEKNEGKVVALTSRVTVLMTLDGNQLLLPNALVFKSVLLNYSRNPKRRFDFATVIGSHTSWNDALELGIATLAGMDGVLADPAPTAQIQELSPDGATLRFMAWIDQRENDLLKTRSEAMRLLRRALREAGITPPAPTQRVQLIREAAVEADMVGDDTSQQRDVSVDHDVDTQVDAARDAHDLQGDKDLLAPKTTAASSTAPILVRHQ